MTITVSVIDVANTQRGRWSIKALSLTIWALKVSRELLVLLLFWWNSFIFLFAFLKSWSSNKMKKRFVNNKVSTVFTFHLKWVIREAMGVDVFQPAPVKSRHSKSLSETEFEGIKIKTTAPQIFLQTLWLWVMAYLMFHS